MVSEILPFGVSSSSGIKLSVDNQLKYLAEFRQTLADYQMSDKSKSILGNTHLALMVAPTSVGRNTIIEELMKTGEYHFIVSDTTRKPRINDGVPEQNGVNYWFRSEEEVLEDLKTGKFLEAAIIHNQQVSGISIRELQKARNDRKIATTDIEVVGVRNIIQAKPDALAFFVLPPSFKEWMRRIEGRGRMTSTEKHRRLESAVEEFEAALKYDYYSFIINDTVEHAVQQIQVVIHDKVDPKNQDDYRQLAEELLKATREYLKS